MSNLSPDEAASIVNSDQKKRKAEKEKKEKEKQKILEWVIKNHGMNEEDIGKRGGGMIKMKYKKGGKVKKRKIDGIARKGKTRGKVV